MSRIAALISVVALSTMIVGCGDETAPSVWDNGSWTGETSSGLQVTFTLQHPHVSDWKLTVTHTYADTTDTRTWTSPSIAVSSDSTFEWSDSLYSDSLRYSFSMNGGFTSGSSASGEWDSRVYYQLGGYSGMDEEAGSWTASGP